MVISLHGITFNLCHKDTIEFAQFVASMEGAEMSLKVLESLDWGSKEYMALYDALYKDLTNNLDKTVYDRNYADFYDKCWSLYLALEDVESDRYYKTNIDDFLEYESHKGEEDFDWGFYSDWHKDIYGYRP